MNDYLICMDASGDIPAQLAREIGLEFIPMEYSLGEEMRVSHGCEDDALLKRFYDGQRNGDLTRTSQVSPFMYEEYFRQMLRTGKSVLYLCLSSGLSTTFDSSRLAAESLRGEFPDQEVLCLDTLAATGGMGVLAEHAAENRRNGMGIRENFDALRALVPQLRLFFMVQDLMYLKRGGRVSAATAIVGSALNVRPLLIIDEAGKLATVGKKRGNKAAASALYEYFLTHYDPEIGKLVYICDADAPELAEQLAARVKEAHPEVTVRRTMLSPVIGAHTGPGMLSMILVGKEPRGLAKG